MNTRVEDFITVTEVDHGPAFVESIFQRRYKQSAPDFPHHIVAFWRRDDGAFVPLCYAHFSDAGEILLGGGACTDDRVLRRLSAAQRDALRTVGGVYQHTLDYAVKHFAPRYAAIFGYCGDGLAERVDLAVGFSKTEYKHLLVYWTRDLAPAQRAVLLAQANAVGPF